MGGIVGAVSVALLWGAACGASGARGSGMRGRPRGLVRAHGPTLAPGTWRHWAPPAGAVSPDRRYLARVKIVEAGAATLTVIDARTRRSLVQADDVEGFAWVPGHPHWLIIAACGMYGRGRLAIWRGDHRWRDLRRVRRPSKECFTLYGVARDGRAIVYGYTPDVLTDRIDLLNRRRWLRLPR